MKFLDGIKDGIIGVFEIIFDGEISYLVGVMFGVTFIVLSFLAILITLCYALIRII